MVTLKKFALIRALSMPGTVSLISSIALLIVPLTGSAIELGEIDGTKVSLKGYIKMDALFSSYDGGALSSGNLGRDFYVPSLTPVGGEEENTTVDMHARQTRFGLETVSTVDGQTLKTYVEMDFLATPNGNERITNSYTPRLRHAFIQYGDWLFGQTWSTFMNVGALPETADFIGSTDGTVFSRQAQVRYTLGGFQFALENPETTVTPFGGGTRIVADDNSLPDMVLRYDWRRDNLTLVAAALFRQLAYHDGGTIDDAIHTAGLSLSGKWAIGKDDVKFAFNTGSGLGRYVGLNVANDAVINASGELEAIDASAYVLAYRHFWSNTWRSTLSYSAIDIDNDTDLTGTGVSSATSSVRGNLMYSPSPRLTLAGELSQAKRELESDLDGSMRRVQFSAKLSF